MTASKTYLSLLIEGIMTDTPKLLLAHHLKALKLPTFLREYDKLARQVRRRRASITSAFCCAWPNWN